MHTQPYSAKIVFICSNEEPQQHCSGKPPWPTLPANETGFPCYINKFKRWAGATKSAAQVRIVTAQVFLAHSNLMFTDNLEGNEEADVMHFDVVRRRLWAYGHSQLVLRS